MEKGGGLGHFDGVGKDVNGGVGGFRIIVKPMLAIKKATSIKPSTQTKY